MTEKEALDTTLARMQGAEASLTMMIEQKDAYSEDFWRLMNKREGLRLGMSYLEEEMRLVD